MRCRYLVLLSFFAVGSINQSDVRTFMNDKRHIDRPDRRYKLHTITYIDRRNGLAGFFRSIFFLVFHSFCPATIKTVCSFVCGWCGSGRHKPTNYSQCSVFGTFECLLSSHTHRRCSFIYQFKRLYTLTVVAAQ